MSDGGVSIFQNCLKFKNVPNVGGGGGVNPNWDIFPNFLVFNERKLVLGLLDEKVKVKVKAKKFKNSMILPELPGGL